MNRNELFERIDVELEDINLTVKYISELLEKIGNNQPDVFEKAAITQLVAQFYNGIENILKNILKYKKVTVPYGANSHIELFNLFISANVYNNPILFTDRIKDEFIGIRKFRHFAIHGYAFKINWEYIKTSVERIEQIYAVYKQELMNYLNE